MANRKGRTGNELAGAAAQMVALGCGRCNSASVHQIFYGLIENPIAERPGAVDFKYGGCIITNNAWSCECLTCGNREYLSERRHSTDQLFYRRAAVDREISTAVTAFTRELRETLQLAEEPLFSGLGLWLLLASVAQNIPDYRIQELTRLLGMPLTAASNVARLLISTPSLAVTAAVGAWAKAPNSNQLQSVTSVEPLPAQSVLDAWAKEHTNGLIREFPLTVTDETLLVLATALTAITDWTDQLDHDHDGMLTLRGGIQTVVATEAAGPVAVAKPFTTGGVDVYSIAAAQDIPASRIWDAVDEVVALANRGALWHGAVPPSDADWDGSENPFWLSGTESNNPWRVWREEILREEVDGELGGRPVRWSSRLPSFATEAVLDLNAAPGVPDVVSAICALFPELAGGTVKTMQAAVARYTDTGFAAAAITAMGCDTGAAPDFSKVTADCVELDFTRPHACIAVGRGGAWEGIPLFSMWVKRKMWQSDRIDIAF